MVAAKPKRNFLTVVDVLVSAGAGVVIFAAWAKLTHKPYADTLLTVGMWTETAIFMVYAAIEWVLPTPRAKAVAAPAIQPIVSKEEISATGKLNKMFEESSIDQENIKKLGESFAKLNTTVSQLGEVGDVVQSTTDFSAKTKEANNALGMMKDAFINSANTMSNFNTAADSAKDFHGQVQILTKNLGNLNSIYELELQESNNHLKSLNNFYSKMAEASEVMVSTVDDAQSTKEQINTLANNLGKLNAVYGNMLSAMQGRQ
ncbi:MAG: gliding motility protein GldL [Ginsengibacter sp.]